MASGFPDAIYLFTKQKWIIRLPNYGKINTKNKIASNIGYFHICGDGGLW